MSGAFTFPRRIGFGDCDPARIFYAPRAIAWAAEAAEAWFEAVAGVSWWEIWARQGLEVRFLSADCEYSRSAAEGQVVEIPVGAALEGETLILSAVGELGPGERSFRARLALTLSGPGRSEAIPIPAPWREAILAYPIAPEALPPERAEPAPRPLAGEEGPGPAVTAAAPFRARRRVGYADCGPSGTARPPLLVDWAVEAAGEWYQATLGVSWQEQCMRFRGAPFVRIRCDFLRPLSAGREIDLAVRIPRLGRASIAYHVAGTDPEGAACLEARMAACYISEEAGTPRPMPFPDELRRRILGYRAACGEVSG